MRCAICGKDGTAADASVPLRGLRPELLRVLRRLHPGLPASPRKGDAVCRSHLIEARRAHVEAMLRADREELSRLDTSVAEAVARDTGLVATLSPEVDAAPDPLGARIADRVARFGGSWRFIIGFASVLIVWMLVNAVLALRAFDPYPFILLNLLLSCVAAFQAPLIMMSQRRQEEQDRARAENDYMVNLKAEVEIRLLHEKIDHILLQQMDHLAEIQSLLSDALPDGAPRRDRRPET